MKIPTARQMSELDQYTIQAENIASIDLMERAAMAVADELLSRYAATMPVVVFAGPGNNGGDALVVARRMAHSGYHVTCYLFNIDGHLSEDCRRNRERLQEEAKTVEFFEVNSQFEPPTLTENTLVIDGLFGTGVNKPLTGGFASLVKFINASDAVVVSIDVPSGLMCEDNTYNVRAHIIQADLTLTFQLPKLALILPDLQTFVGELKILPIGLSEEGMARIDTPYQIVEKEDISRLIRHRDAFAHKGTFGHGLLVAGRYGMAGAAVLAARACLRSGIGKVTVHTPQRNNDILQLSVPEAILTNSAGDEHITQSISSEPFQAVAIGPGIGTEQTTAVAFIEQVRHTRVPLVVDADGLNILAEHKGWMQQMPAGCILTPHPVEMRRIGIRSTDSYSTLLESMEIAARYKSYVILKGHYTAICTPEGRIFFNPTGNSGMATAGSGDVLTGIILALLAQGYVPQHACLLGVYVHGLAGDMAAQELGEISLTASDIVNYLPRAFQALQP